MPAAQPVPGVSDQALAFAVRATVFFFLFLTIRSSVPAAVAAAVVAAAPLLSPLVLTRVGQQVSGEVRPGQNAPMSRYAAEDHGAMHGFLAGVQGRNHCATRD